MVVVTQLDVTAMELKYLSTRSAPSRACCPRWSGFNGFCHLLPGDGTTQSLVQDAGSITDQALLMGLAERADVIVDFRDLTNGLWCA